MTIDDRLLLRVRGEFQEMPGLRLSLAQACRLWQMDGTTCLAILEQLIVERYLYRTGEGMYVALPSGRPTPLKASLPGAHPAGAHVRRLERRPRA